MDLETGILRAIFRCDRQAYLDAVRAGLSSEFFLDEKRRETWDWISVYSRDYGSIPPQPEVAKHFPEVFAGDEEPAAVDYYLRELKNRRLHFRLKDALLDVGQHLKDREPREALQVLEQAVIAAQDDARNACDLEFTRHTNIRLEEYRRMKELGGLSGICTPWPKLDTITLGWKPGELIVVAARPGTGKSYMVTLLSLAAHAAGKVPLIVSREMAADQFMKRLDALAARISHSGLRSGDLSEEQEQRYLEMLEGLKEKASLWVSSDDAAMGISGLAAKVDSINPDILFLDGLYLMRDDRGETGWEGITNLTHDMKRLAVRKNIPVVVTTQFNRKAKGMKSGLEMLAFSDSIGQDADVVLGLLQTDEMRERYEMCIRILKQREGLQGEFRIRWDLEVMNFEEIHEATPEPSTMSEEELEKIIDFN